MGLSLSAVTGILTREHIFIQATHTVQQIIEIVEEEDKRERLYEFIANMEEDDKVLVFVGKKAVYVD